MHHCLIEKRDFALRIKGNLKFFLRHAVINSFFLSIVKIIKERIVAWLTIITRKNKITPRITDKGKFENLFE